MFGKSFIYCIGSLISSLLKMLLVGLCQCARFPALGGIKIGNDTVGISSVFLTLKYKGKFNLSFAHLCNIAILFLLNVMVPY